MQYLVPGTWYLVPVIIIIIKKYNTGTIYMNKYKRLCVINHLKFIKKFPVYPTATGYSSATWDASSGECVLGPLEGHTVSKNLKMKFLS